MRGITPAGVDGPQRRDDDDAIAQLDAERLRQLVAEHDAVFAGLRVASNEPAVTLSAMTVTCRSSSGSTPVTIAPLLLLRRDQQRLIFDERRSAEHGRVVADPRRGVLPVAEAQSSVR